MLLQDLLPSKLVDPLFVHRAALVDFKPLLDTLCVKEVHTRQARTLITQRKLFHAHRALFPLILSFSCTATAAFIDTTELFRSPHMPRRLLILTIGVEQAHKPSRTRGRSLGAGTITTTTTTTTTNATTTSTYNMT